MTRHYGFIYAMSNSLFPWAIKIGRSAEDPEFTRVKNANTYSPEEYYILWKKWVPKVNKKERDIQYILSSYKIRGEWYSAPLELIIECCEQVVRTPDAKFNILPRMVRSYDYSDVSESESDEDDSDDEDIETVPWKYKGNYYSVDMKNNLVYNRDTQEAVGKWVNGKLKKFKK